MPIIKIILNYSNHQIIMNSRQKSKEKIQSRREIFSDTEGKK